MSDELVHEIKMDLEREREKIFFRKYKYFIIGTVITVLGAFFGYQYYTNHEKYIANQAALNYEAITDYYNISASDASRAKNAPKLKQETIKNMPAYLAMVTLTKFSYAQQNDASVADLYEITQDYIHDKSVKPHTIYDALIRVYDLSLEANNYNGKLSELEAKVNSYLNHPFAFKSVAYEILWTQAIKSKNIQQAQHYLKNMQENVTNANLMNKIQIMKAHPLLKKVN